MPLEFPVLIRFLQEAHALETGTLEQLDAFNPGFASIEASEAVQRYKLACQDQLRVVTMRLESFGARQSSAKGFMNVIFGKAADWVNTNASGEERTTLLLARYYGAAQLKGATYDAIWAYATGLSDQETANLALKFRQADFDWALAMFPLIADSTKEEERPAPPPFMM